LGAEEVGHVEMPAQQPCWLPLTIGAGFPRLLVMDLG
jgi:hypothetical protein